MLWASTAIVTAAFLGSAAAHAQTAEDRQKVAQDHATYEDVPGITGVTYLNSVTFPVGTRYDDYRIDGLSGIDYNRATNQFVSERDNYFWNGGPNGDNVPPYFTLKPVFRDDVPGYSVKFVGVQSLNDTTAPVPMNQLESIRHDPKGDGYWLSSEEPPTVWHVHANGVREQIKLSGQIVAGFYGANGNSAFEGLTFTPNGGLYISRENAAQADSANVIRLSKVNADGSPAAQYAYRLDNVVAINRDNAIISNVSGTGAGATGVGNNGVSELLALTDSTFLVMERAWDGLRATTSPTGVSHNYIRIYKVDITGATDIKDMASVSETSVPTLKKTLIFDSTTLANTLNTYDLKIDNIEGMSIGPVLADGHATIILVSDSNGSTGQRKTQFVVLKVDSAIPDRQYWDGTGAMADGRASGGSGLWSANPANENWTRASGAINDGWNGRIAIFDGSAGDVTLDARSGAIGASELRFLRDGYRLTGDALTVHSAGTLVSVANVGDRATFANALAGSGLLTKAGQGTLILNGDSSGFTGSVLVAQGMLDLTGTLGGSTTIGDRGRMIGTGTVDALAVNAGGIIAPGEPGVFGTLVAHRYSQAAGSTLSIRIGNAGQTDALAIRGANATATLNGTLEVVATSGTPRFGDQFGIVTGNAAITGMFANVASNLPGVLRPVVTYGNNAVTLSIGAASYATQIDGTSSVQRAYARLLDTGRSEYAAHARFYDALDPLSAGTLQPLLQRSAPSVYQTRLSIARAQTEALSGFYRDRLGDAMPEAERGRLTMVGRPLQFASLALDPRFATRAMMSDATSDGATADRVILPDNVAAYVAVAKVDGSAARAPGAMGRGRDSVDSWYATTGIEMEPADGARLGLAAAYGRNDGANRTATGDRVDSDLIAMTLYGHSRLSRLDVSGQASLGFYNARTQRTASLSATPETLRSRNSALVSGAELGIAAPFAMAGLTIAPSVAFRASRLDFGTATERGGQAALNLRQRVYVSLQQRLGATITGRAVVGGLVIQPHADMTYVHDYRDSMADMSAGLVGSLRSATFLGTARDSDWGEMASGLRLTSGRVSLDASASSTFDRSDLSFRTYKLAMRVAF